MNIVFLRPLENPRLLHFQPHLTWKKYKIPIYTQKTSPKTKPNFFLSIEENQETFVSTTKRKMTRASKRKSDQQSSASVKSARVDSVRSASNRGTTKMQERIDELYIKYANESSGVIDPEAIEALCSDLKVHYTDVKMLMLAWKMNAQKQGFFTQDEWRRGLKALRVDTINKLKKALPGLEREVLKPDNFEDFYKYAFRYSLTEEKQKCLDIESSCMLIDLVLGFQYRSQVDSFIKFLKDQIDYKVINMDQWTNFLRFCQEISFPDLQNYDTCEAWPLLLDNFVDWMKQKANV